MLVVQAYVVEKNSVAYRPLPIHANPGANGGAKCGG
jgi:hypothetical protein